MSLRCWLWSSLCLVASCRFDASVDADAGVVIECRDGVCPQGYQCALSTLQCVKAADVDNTPPGIDGSPRVRLELPGQRLYPVPEALGPAGFAHVSFSVTEALSADPVLTSQPELKCLREDASGLTFTFLCSLPEGASPFMGSARLEASLTDVARNTATVPVEVALLLDSVPPAAPTVDTPDAFRLVRRPWGAGDSDGGVLTTLVVGAAPDEPSSLLVYDESLTAVLAFQADAGMSTLTVGPRDFTRVAVGYLDRAGNESPARLLRDLTWVATMGNKVVGRPGNPHTLKAHAVHGDALTRSDGTELAASSGVAFPDGVASHVEGGWTWERHTAEAPESGVRRRVVAYDTARSRIVSWGGVSSGSESGAVGEWDGRQWRLVVPLDPEFDGTPANRFDSAGAFDPASKLLVVFGGTTLDGVTLGDTWGWTGSSWRSLAAGPDARSRHAMSYDPLDGRVLLFGGLVDGGPAADTWRFDGESWQRVVTSGPAPGARAGHALLFHPRLGGSLLLGGATLEHDGGQEAWLFDQAGWRRAPGADLPAEFPSVSAAYDSARDVVVMLVGSDGGNPLWELSDGGWRNVAAPGGPDVVWPNGTLRDESLAFDSARGETCRPGYALYYCFFACLLTESEPTHTWNGTRWTEVRSLFSHPPRSEVNLLREDRDGGRVVWVGVSGTTADGGVRPSSAVWSGEDWTVLGPDAGLPDVTALASVEPFRFFGALSSSPQTPVLLTLTTQASTVETWALRGTSWSRASVDSSLPAGLRTSGATFQGDPVMGGQLLGTPASPFYRWTGAAWQPLAALPMIGLNTLTHAVGLPDAGLLFHAADNARASAWSWAMVGSADGGAVWEALAGPAPLVTMGAIALEEGAGKVALATGVTRAVNSDVLYEFQGSRWAVARLSDPEGDGQPGGRFGSGMAWHAPTGRLVLHGGVLAATGVETVPQTWLLHTSGERPAFAFTALVDEVFSSGAVPTALQVRARAAGDSPQGPGARVLLRQDGRWAPLTESAAPGLQWLSGTVTDESTLRRLLSHQSEVALAVVPVGTTGLFPATADLDYLELSLSARLPATP